METEEIEIGLFKMGDAGFGIKESLIIGYWNNWYFPHYPSGPRVGRSLGRG